LEDYKEKYYDLINKGCLIYFYEEDREDKLTGSFHAFCVSIRKNGKTILNLYSKRSFKEALIVAHEILEVRFCCNNNFSSPRL